MITREQIGQVLAKTQERLYNRTTVNADRCIAKYYRQSRLCTPQTQTGIVVGMNDTEYIAYFNDEFNEYEQGEGSTIQEAIENLIQELLKEET